MSIAIDTQVSAPGQLIIMYDLDFTRVGGSIYYLSQQSYANSPLVWRGHEYQKIGIIGEGWESRAEGTLPRPTVQVSNIRGALLSVVRSLRDGIGGKVTRWKTYAKYLDGSPTADPDMHFPKDIYVIEQKLYQNPMVIKWELAALMDFQGKMLPGRQVLRDYCRYTYRRWNGTSFVSRATNPELIECDYEGASYFTELDEVTTDPALDKCSKLLTGCRLRFPGQAVPTGAFPNVSRNRVKSES